MNDALDVGTDLGQGRLHLAAGAQMRGVLLLSHGAGNGIEARDLQALARDLPAQGFAVALFEQPWRVAGRRLATPPPTLDVGLRAAAGALRHAVGEVPLIVGGRSAGARSATRCAASLDAAGCLALAFPLHPPGKPEKSRLAELQVTSVPTLVVQGERDTFGRPEEFPDDVELAVVPAADHGFAVAKSAPISQDDALGIIVESVLEWLVREIC